MKFLDITLSYWVLRGMKKQPAKKPEPASGGDGEPVTKTFKISKQMDQQIDEAREALGDIDFTAFVKQALVREVLRTRQEFLQNRPAEDVLSGVGKKQTTPSTK